MRHRRFYRRKLTAKQMELAESSDRAELYANVLVVGIADVLRHVSTQDDLKQVKRLIDDDLTTAFQTSAFTYKLYVDSMKVKKGKKHCDTTTHRTRAKETD